MGASGEAGEEEVAGAGGMTGEGTPHKKTRCLSKGILRFYDFSTILLEEHYKISHPFNWGEFVSDLERNGSSMAWREIFFDRTKISAHFALRTPASKVVQISHSVGCLARNCIAAKLITALELSLR